MQAHIDYEHNAVMLNKIGARLTMFDHIPMKSEAAPSSGGGRAATPNRSWPDSEPLNNQSRNDMVSTR
jgi:hypothetical protein